MIEYTLDFKKRYRYMYREYILSCARLIVRIQCVARAVVFPDYEKDFGSIIQGITVIPDKKADRNYHLLSENRPVVKIPIKEIVTDTTVAFLTSYDSICGTNEKSFLWKVSSPSTSIFILGSIHVATPEFYPLKPVIEEAFSQSDILVLEIDATSWETKNAIRAYMSKMIYPEGKSLNDLLTDSFSDSLKAICSELHFPGLTSYSRYQPWILGLTLGQLKMKQLGFAEKYGIDDYFLRNPISVKCL